MQYFNCFERNDDLTWRGCGGGGGGSFGLPYKLICSVCGAVCVSVCLHAAFMVVHDPHVHAHHSFDNNE